MFLTTKPTTVYYNGPAYSTCLRLVTWIPYHQSATPCVMIQVAGEVEGVPTREDAERLYCALARIPYPQPDIPFYKALSFFRRAAIAQVCAK